MLFLCTPNDTDFNMLQLLNSGWQKRSLFVKILNELNSEIYE